MGRGGKPADRAKFTRRRNQTQAAATYSPRILYRASMQSSQRWSGPFVGQAVLDAAESHRQHDVVEYLWAESDTSKGHRMSNENGYDRLDRMNARKAGFLA